MSVSLVGGSSSGGGGPVDEEGATLGPKPDALGENGEGDGFDLLAALEHERQALARFDRQVDPDGVRDLLHAARTGRVHHHAGRDLSAGAQGDGHDP